MNNILLVEDNEPLQRAYKTILSKAGYTVTVASDGEIALELVKQQDFKLILLDILMPHLDGIGFLEIFRKKEHKGTLVIAFSNLDDAVTVAEARRLGVDDYLIKANTSPNQVLYHVERAFSENKKASS